MEKPRPTWKVALLALLLVLPGHVYLQSGDNGIGQWFARHSPGWTPVLYFLVMPAGALALGAIAFWGSWRENDRLGPPIGPTLLLVLAVLLGAFMAAICIPSLLFPMRD